MGALVEIDFVAGFEAQTYGTESRFDARGGIDCGIQAGGAKAEDGAGYVTVGEQAGAKPEVHQTGFESCEGTESASAGLKFRAE